MKIPSFERERQVERSTLFYLFFNSKDLELYFEKKRFSILFLSSGTMAELNTLDETTMYTT